MTFHLKLLYAYIQATVLNVIMQSIYFSPLVVQSAFYENNSWYLEPVFSVSFNFETFKVFQDVLVCIMPVLQL